MKVKMLAPIAGNANPDYNLPDFSFAAGEIVDVNASIANAWLASGLATPVPDGGAGLGSSLTGNWPMESGGAAQDPTPRVVMDMGGA